MMRVVANEIPPPRRGRTAHGHRRRHARRDRAAVQSAQRRAGRRVGPPDDHWSRRVWDNLQRFGFAGTVFPVNPNRTRDLGRAVLSETLAALPETPDHLAIFTPAETSLHVLHDGAAAGARSATFYAAGFGEGGDEEGLRSARKLRDDHRRHRAHGGRDRTAWASPAANPASAPSRTRPCRSLQPSPVAVVAQSGAMCASINRAINELGLKIGYFASCGGQIGCKVSDFIDYFAGQPELRVILCYIEGVPDAARFLAAARRARRNGKTVRGGEDRRLRSRARLRAGAYRLARPAAPRCSRRWRRPPASCGCPRSRTPSRRWNSWRACPLPRGRNIAVMTNSGALRNLITEAADRTGATLVPLSPATHAALGKALGQSDITNPLDTKRTIPTSAIRGLPRRAGGCARGRHRAHRRGPAARRRRGTPRRQSARDRARCRARAADWARPWRRSRRSSVSTTDYGRAVRAQIPQRAVAARHRAHVAGHAGARGGRQPPIGEPSACCPPIPSVTRHLAHARGRARSSDRAQRGRIRNRSCAPTASRCRTERLVRTADEAVDGRARDRLPGRAQGRVGRAAAQERRRPGAPQPRRRGQRAASGRRPDGARGARSRPRSTVYWWHSRCPEASNPCSASAAIVEMGPVVMFGLGGIWSSCSRT